MARRLGGWDDGGSTGKRGPQGARRQGKDSPARLLAPPREPLPPTDLTGCAKLLSAPLVLLALLGLGLAAGLGVVLILRGFENVPYFLGAIGLLAVFSFGAVAFARWAVRGARARTEAKRQQRQEERVLWRGASDRWTQLYFCARDAGVFHPAERRWVSVGDLRRYLFGRLPAPTSSAMLRDQ